MVDMAPPTCASCRMVMPYDYMVLADAVLWGQGYASRPVLARMAGASTPSIAIDF